MNTPPTILMRYDRLYRRYTKNTHTTELFWHSQNASTVNAALHQHGTSKHVCFNVKASTHRTWNKLNVKWHKLFLQHLFCFTGCAQNPGLLWSALSLTIFGVTRKQNVASNIYFTYLINIGQDSFLSNDIISRKLVKISWWTFRFDCLSRSFIRCSVQTY